MKATLTQPTNGIKILKYHSRHCVIIDTTQTPIKRLWESTKGMGEHHINNRNPEQECKQWLTDNGYAPIEGTDCWTNQPLKRFALIRMAYQGAKQECLLECSRDTIQDAVAYFNQCYPSTLLDKDGYRKTGNETWCVAEFFHA